MQPIPVLVLNSSNAKENTHACKSHCTIVKFYYSFQSFFDVLFDSEERISIVTNSSPPGKTLGEGHASTSPGLLLCHPIISGASNSSVLV